MGNSASVSNNEEGIPEQNNNIIGYHTNHTWEKAVNGNTEELNLRPKVTHAAFESTSENMPFTVSEKAVPAPVKNNYANLSETSVMQQYNETNADKPYYNEYMQAKQKYLNSKSLKNNMKGGFIFDKLANLFNETEVNVFDNNSNLIDTKLNQIKSLLQDTETNNLVGGDVSSQKLRELLLQDTESFLNFRGGENKESEHEEANQNELKEEHKEPKKHEEQEEHEEHKESKEHKKQEHKKQEHKKEEKEEKEEKEVEEISEQMQKTDEEESDQSGGENLDTELKVILKELQANNKNNHKGGKSSRKSSKKSNKSKKQSRRATTEESEATNGTYDIDTDSGDDNEDYLTSTSSMNTSDININHYKS
jgi:hypothetical protein